MVHIVATDNRGTNCGPPECGEDCAIPTTLENTGTLAEGEIPAHSAPVHTILSTRPFPLTLEAAVLALEARGVITVTIDLLLQRRASPLQLPKLLLVAFDLTALLNAPALNGSRSRIALKSLLLLTLSG